MITLMNKKIVSSTSNPSNLKSLKTLKLLNLNYVDSKFFSLFKRKIRDLNLINYGVLGNKNTNNLDDDFSLENETNFKSK